MKKLIFYNFIKPYYEWFTEEVPVSTLRIITSIYLGRYNILNDRFGILTRDCEYNLQSRNDSIEYIKNLPNKSFEEICNDRTNEIIDYADTYDKDIYVSWSGGVDSTCVVCSLLMNERLNKSRFHLIFSEESIGEYPYFYELMHKNKIDMINAKQDVLKFRDVVGYNVSVNGMNGDQLDGSNLHTMKYQGVGYFNNWIDDIRKILFPEFKKPVIFDKFVSDVEEYSNKIGVNLNIFGEFAWLFNYSVKWTYIAEFMKCLHLNPDANFAFFDTNDFSHYALVNFYQRGIKKQYTSYDYKLDWKKIIYKYTKDENYFLNKGKEANFFNDNNKAWYGMSVADTTGYYIFNDKDPAVVKDIMLPYIKDEYKEFYHVDYRI